MEFLFKICRLCKSEKDQCFVSIYKELMDGQIIADLIKIVCGIHVPQRNQTDLLPKEICGTCLLCLLSVKKLRKTARKSLMYFEELYKKVEGLAENGEFALQPDLEIEVKMESREIKKEPLENEIERAKIKSGPKVKKIKRLKEASKEIEEDPEEIEIDSPEEEEESSKEMEDESPEIEPQSSEMKNEIDDESLIIDTVQFLDSSKNKKDFTVVYGMEKEKPTNNPVKPNQIPHKFSGNTDPKYSPYNIKSIINKIVESRRRTVEARKNNQEQIKQKMKSSPRNPSKSIQKLPQNMEEDEVIIKGEMVDVDEEYVGVFEVTSKPEASNKSLDSCVLKSQLNISLKPPKTSTEYENLEIKRLVEDQSNDSLGANEKDLEVKKVVEEKGKKKSEFESRFSDDEDSDYWASFFEPTKNPPRKRRKPGQIEEPLFKCNHCKMTFKSEYNMKLHVEAKTCRPHEKTKAICPECGLILKDTAGLYAHKRRVHQPAEKVYRFCCDYCGRKFVGKRTLQNHMKTIHLLVFDFKCSYCSREFSKKVGLDAHVNSIHLNNRTFKCPVCPKAFSTKAHLKAHSIVHTGERLFKCKYCDKDYAYLTDLKRHTETHTGEYSYRCEICNKGFNKKSTLTSHQNVHKKS